ERGRMAWCKARMVGRSRTFSGGRCRVIQRAPSRSSMARGSALTPWSAAPLWSWRGYTPAPYATGPTRCAARPSRGSSDSKSCCCSSRASGRRGAGRRDLLQDPDHAEGPDGAADLVVRELRLAAHGVHVALALVAREQQQLLRGQRHLGQAVLVVVRAHVAGVGASDTAL